MSEINLRVKVPSKTSHYSITFGYNHWQKTLSTFLKKNSFSKVGFLVDENVFAFWKNDIENFPHGIITLIPSGETSKTIEKAMEIINNLSQQGFDRKSLLVAIGGGVVGDLCGFVASLYMRGIPFVQIPTTVLSIVDSSIGGKTGVDTSSGKNYIGSFHFPSLVIADIKFLESLPDIQKKNGYVEMLKHALIADKHYFQNLIHNHSQKEWPSLLWRSCQIKAEIVRKDPKEKNLRQILNFGHTLGHAIEHAAGYQLLHGLAIAWGIVGETFLSFKKGFLSRTHLETIIDNLKQTGVLLFPEIILNLKWESLLMPLIHDKKNKQGNVHVVLLHQIGKVLHHKNQYSYPIDKEKLYEAFIFIKEIAEKIYEGH